MFLNLQRLSAAIKDDNLDDNIVLRIHWHSGKLPIPIQNLSKMYLSQSFKFCRYLGLKITEEHKNTGGGTVTRASLRWNKKPIGCCFIEDAEKSKLTNKTGFLFAFAMLPYHGQLRCCEKRNFVESSLATKMVKPLRLRNCGKGRFGGVIHRFSSDCCGSGCRGAFARLS